MHNESQVLGYQPGDSFIYQLNATTKLVFMLLVSVACMVTYDTRFLIAICILSIFLFKEAKINLAIKYQLENPDSFVRAYIDAERDEKHA